MGNEPKIEMTEQSKTFLIIDSWNLLYRARFSARGDVWTALGLSLHIVMNSIKSSYKKFNADHVVFAYEGSSWRKQFDENYKRNRIEARSKMSNTEVEEDTIFTSAFIDFQDFIKHNTNATVLRQESCEADDMVAAWIQTHPNDNHIIVSGDTDFQQLIAKNVTLYDGVNRRTYTIDGVFDEKGKPVMEKKSKKPLVVNPEYALFKKIIRGDTSDNVFSAYPTVRETKILEAFQDRQKKGYPWNNFMMSRWVDHNKNEVKVKDRYEHNKVLIDLTAQPEIIRNYMDETIVNVYKENKSVKNIGFNLLKFCGKYQLNSLAENSKEIVEILGKRLFIE
jgi:5'-3' exonuclease